MFVEVGIWDRGKVFWHTEFWHWGRQNLWLFKLWPDLSSTKSHIRNIQVTWTVAISFHYSYFRQWLNKRLICNRPLLVSYSLGQTLSVLGRGCVVTPQTPPPLFTLKWTECLCSLFQHIQQNEAYSFQLFKSCHYEESPSKFIMQISQFIHYVGIF